MTQEIICPSCGLVLKFKVDVEFIGSERREDENQQLFDEILERRDIF